MSVPEDGQVDGISTEDIDEEPATKCAHEWVCSGTAYGGDDERWHGEGRMYCTKCGADGDG